MHFPLSAHLFRELADNAIDAIVIIDAQCGIRYANAALERLVGYRVDALIGQSAADLLPPVAGLGEDAERVSGSAGFHDAVTSGGQHEMQVRHRDGELIPVEMKALDLGRDGDERFFAAFLVDIRERRRLEAKNAGLLAQLHQQALTDSLTGLPNRRAFDAEASRLLVSSRRECRPFVVGVADVDWFKQVNDGFGHAAGDQVLRAVATALQQQLRKGDYIARIGGEEFGLLFSGTTLAEARLAAERLRAGVAAARVRVNGSVLLQTAISIGVAQADLSQPVDAAMAQADRALYEAKRTGRNRVETWRETIEVS